MTAATYREPQHPRDGQGRWKDSGWSPKHGMSGKTRVRIGAAGVAVSAFGVLEGALNLVGAILAVGAASLIAWGGYKGAKRRKRRRAGIAPRPRSGTKVTRFGTVRLGDEKAIEAYAKLQRQRQERRDEVWGRRKAAAAAGVRRVTGKKESAFAQWPAATVTPDPSLSPEDKFKTLRDSGYKGWIDQDGNAVADVDEWVAKQRAGAS